MPSTKGFECRKTEVCSQTTHANRRCKLCFFVLIITPYYNHIQISFRFSFGIIECMRMILLMEEILHHLGCIKPCKIMVYPYIYHINWCRISSINSITEISIMMLACFRDARDVLCWNKLPRLPEEFRHRIDDEVIWHTHTHIGGSVDEWQVAIWKPGWKIQATWLNHRIFLQVTTVQPVIDPGVNIYLLNVIAFIWKTDLKDPRRKMMLSWTRRCRWFFLIGKLVWRKTPSQN